MFQALELPCPNEPGQEQFFDAQTLVNFFHQKHKHMYASRKLNIILHQT